MSDLDMTLLLKEKEKNASRETNNQCSTMKFMSTSNMDYKQILIIGSWKIMNAHFK